MAIGRQTQYGFKNTLEEKQYPPPKAATQSNFFLGGGVPEKSTEQVKPAYYNKREAQFAPVTQEGLRQTQDYNAQFVQRQK